MVPVDQRQIAALQSKVVTRDEFNFDRMIARPLYTLLSIYDIDQLYNVATSVRYAGNAQKKYQAIDEIMHNRGFKKLSAGTNRVVYTYFEDPTIVVKVAADKTGIMDNPREFVNQHRLKPFCTKTFEVDPTGVVAVAERVRPITSREEYQTVAGDVFDMLDTITGKYILADIGSRYYMNIGLRHEFGVVLLDYPYLYETDGSKLVCKKPDQNSPTGVCGGLIDYDEGFNTLRCNKCGKVFRAIELGKYLETNQIVKGVNKMADQIKVNVTYNGKTVSNTVASPVKNEAEVISHQKEEKKEEHDGNILTIKVKKDGKETVNHIDTSQSHPDIPQYNYNKLKQEKKDKKNKFNNNNNQHKQNNQQNHNHQNNNQQKPVEKKVEAKPEVKVEDKKESNMTYVSVNTDGPKLVVAKNNISVEAELTVDEINPYDIKKEAQKKLDEKENKIKELEAIISEDSTLREELEKAKSDLNKKEEELIDLSNRYDIAISEKNNSSNTTKQLEEHIKELESQVADYKERIEGVPGLENRLAELETENYRLKNQLEEFNTPNHEEVSENDKEEYDDDYEDGNGGIDGYLFLDGYMYNVSDFANLTGMPMPDEVDGVPLDKELNIIAFKNEDGDDYIRDTYGNIIVIKSMNRCDSEGNIIEEES